MRNSVLILLMFLCLPIGCSSNTGYHGESLESIRSRHAEMVQGYKYGSVAEGYYDENLEPGASASDADRGEQFLLAIGVDKYQELPNLEGASREARVLALTLKNDFGFKVKVLNNPTREDIRVTVKRYRNMLRPDSRLVVFFAGHGWRDEATGQGYWLPRDAKMDSRDGWLSATEITSTFRSMEARDILVIADSCFLASPAPQAEPVPAADQPPVPEQKVRVALTSGTIAPAEGEADSGSFVFMDALLDALQHCRGPIKGADLYAAVKDRMTAQHAQPPRYGVIPDSGHQGGDFVFAPLAVDKAAAN